MLTIEQAITENEFHCGNCTHIIGPRGGITVQSTVCRRSGKTQTWKRDKTRFQLPVKCGLRENAVITNLTAEDWHCLSNCPINNV